MWYFINLLSIIGIVFCAKFDKRLTIKLGGDIEKPEYDEDVWFAYYNGRKIIYQIICITALIPLINFATFWITVLGLLAWFVRFFFFKIGRIIDSVTK
jgi:hypothetical protein